MSILHDGLDAWVIIIDHHFVTIVVTMIEECLHCHLFRSVRLRWIHLDAVYHLDSAGSILDGC